MADFQTNNWIPFLRQYGPIPRNDNMYDETIQRVLRRARLQPLSFPIPLLEELLSNFRADTPASVILTGTAGDGKTYICRQVWLTVGGSQEEWDSDVKVRRAALASGITLTVVKDLSELSEEDRAATLPSMADAVCGGPTHTSEVFLIAANDGQLVDAWKAAPDSPTVHAMRALVEELLVTNQQSLTGHPLHLHNLSRTSAAGMFDVILEAILGHPGWDGCRGCRGQEQGAANRCPIWENYTRLQQPLFRQRLRSLLQLCDQNELHLPIRQLLLLASNTLLGHSKGKEGLLRCNDVPRVVGEDEASLASPYSNAFGQNLSVARRESTEVFEVIGRFGIGEETSNRIDNLLIYGSDDEPQRAAFDALVGLDDLYGATRRFRTLQAAYLEGMDLQTCEEFLRAMRMQRQRLFFTMPEGHTDLLRLWDLTVFHFAGEYLSEVYEALRAARKPPQRIVLRLVRGMNRIFTGMLTTTERQLALATSGSYSQARVSRIEEALVNVEPNLGQRVVLELYRNRIHLVVFLAPTTPVRLALNLVRYEFLSRVAEGALPSSFSRECYEDLLAFKSRLLREYQAVQLAFGEARGEQDLNLKLLQLDERGLIFSEAIDLQLS